MSIILASSSPRRRELLEMLGVQRLMIIAAKDGEHPPRGASAYDTVAALASAKAEEVFSRLNAVDAMRDGDVVVAADTVVELDGRILGKPEGRSAARAMLKSLSGRSHRVYTGLALIGADGERLNGTEVTTVSFRELNAMEIDRYIDSGEPFDKAGGYGIQGMGSLFVEAIDGDYFNVVGLPLCRLGIMLKKLGVELI